MYEFLPTLLSSSIEPYVAYNPHLPPGISHLFSAAAFRYPHTWIPPGLFLRLVGVTNCMKVKSSLNNFISALRILHL